ncbi:MAG TPA: response regulator [Verrucomicrobiae bacterium]|nr:response regulator [Verrucomicrobiae bacterium]
MQQIEAAKLAQNAARPASVKRILIVDDEPAVRGALRAMVPKSTYTVTEAGDGVEALDVIAKGHADIVVLDLKMPRKGGIATLREIKARWPGIQVIAISGEGLFADESRLESSIVLGASFMIEKPISRAKFLAALETMARR